ncbi:tetratricopeptide repeat protein [Micromonospora deserti]|uniref:tetratricopeptide repeat protein n=1 Tax=Micromonospora deserti TaxID=2070366 RepID=UPI0011B82675|nr:tetratricopeptide repeat protein [Micromonospora deserti]
MRNVLEGLSWPAGILALLLALAALVRPPSVEKPATVELTDPLIGAEYAFDGRLPTIGEVSLRDLGVSDAISVPTRSAPDVPYIARDFDPVLEQALRDGGTVLLHGPASVGKTRSAAEALRRLYPNRPLLVPVDGRWLQRAVTWDFDLAGVLVWLDDLERFLTPQGLDPAILHVVQRKGATVVATIRDRELACYENAAATRRGDIGVDRLAVNVVAAIPPDRRIAVGRLLTTSEASRARKSDDPRIAGALRAEVGFAEYLAAGPAMLRRWSVGDDPLFYVGQAVINAAVDIRRAGYHEYVSESVLSALYRQYVPPGWRERHDLPPARLGLTWASQRVLGASSCLRQRHDARHGGLYLASDYLVDRAVAGEGPLGGVAVCSAVWDTVLALADGFESLAVGLAAQDAGLLDIAANAYFRAGVACSPIAMYDHAHAMATLGNFAQAERFFRSLSVTGDTNAMVRLANLLNAQGRGDEAQVLYELASRAGNLRAEARIALLYAKDDGGKERDVFYRQAADAGNTDAMVVLAHMLAEREDHEEADRLYRRAAARGNTDAMVAEARRSEDEDAESLYRRAAEAGNTDAMTELALRLIRRGRTTEAQEFFERAGHPHSSG